MNSKVLYITDSCKMVMINDLTYTISREAMSIYTMDSQEIVYDDIVDRTKINGTFTVPVAYDDICPILYGFAKRDTIIRDDDIMIYRCKLLSQQTIGENIHVKFTARSIDKTLVILRDRRNNE